ncbi:MAG TPA: ferritin-like domain-containing protein [Solirubrobacteraceae bacterium]|nr:ferritin-like domain-containing protein [Solirubrobacteraceae bacterium]
MTGRVVIADGDADTAQVAAFERDRRELLRRGFGLGGAAIAAASIPLLLSVRNAFAESRGDAAILSDAIDLERVAVLAYDTVIERGLLSPALRATARRFRAHEQEHADALTTALTDVGGTPPAPPTGIADVDEVVKGLGDVRSQAEVVSFAIELETAAVAAYHDAQAKLVEARLLQTGASIMASEGQHLVVLRTAAGRNPIPNAFETGAR